MICHSGGELRLLLKLLIAVLLWILVLMVSSALAMLVVGQSEGAPTWQVGLVTHTVMLLMSLLLMLWLGRGSLKSYGVTKPDSFKLLSCAGWGLVLGIGVTITAALIGGQAALPDSRMSILQQILFVWIWASICEEFFLRGLIQSYLQPFASRSINIRNIKFTLPVIVSALLFGLMHLGLLSTGAQPVVVLVVVVFAFGIGIAAGYYRERSLSLMPAVLVHVFGNIGGSLAEWLSW